MDRGGDREVAFERVVDVLDSEFACAVRNAFCFRDPTDAPDIDLHEVETGVGHHVVGRAVEVGTFTASDTDVDAVRTYAVA